jgi:hypothetical protein
MLTIPGVPPGSYLLYYCLSLRTYSVFVDFFTKQSQGWKE